MPPGKCRSPGQEITIFPAEDNIAMLIVNAVAMLTRKVGDYLYRVEQPSLAMGKSGKAVVVTVSTISPWFETLCLRADVLILHLLSEHDLLPIMEERRRQGRPTVYELSDNILALHEGVGVRGWFSDPLNLALAFHYLKLADGVQVTGPGLAERFGFVNERTVIFENQMATVGSAGRQASDRVIVGWAGSSGHKRDIEAVADSVAQVMRDCPQVDFAFMGDEGIYRVLAASLPQGRITHTPPGTLEEYLLFLQKLTIGIAPLEDNPYNRCRSDVKFLEYASRGVVPVLSSLAPYRASAQPGETAFLYESPRQLVEILSALAHDADLRDRIGRAAHAYVMRSRRETVHAERRLAFYTRLLGKDTETSALPGEIPFVRCDDDAEYYEVSRPPAETALLEGIHHDAAGSYDAALGAYHRAAEMSTDYALPWFWLGYCSLRRGDPEAASWFDEAIKRNPALLRAYWLKAKALQERDPEAALQELITVLKRSPDYAPAAVSMAELLETHGAWAEAIHWYDEALRSNPFISPAALGLGRIYGRQGETEKAGIALRTAADLAPAWAEAQYRAAEWYFAENDRENAVEYCRRAMIADPSHAGVKDLIKKLTAT
jgi:tetratricopeptide (TPR) repeat protein